MKIGFLLFVCTTVIINFGTCTATGDVTSWEEFKGNYSKTYSDPETEQKRKGIFDSNIAMINAHNEKFKKGEVTFSMGINKFGDLTHEEFLKEFSVKETPKKDANVDTENHVHVFDDNSSLKCNWKDELEAVKKDAYDQLSECKSGWAYSAAEAIAARYEVRYKKNCTSLCINYLIKCSDGMGNHGCNGGLAKKACELVKSTQKMPDEKSFQKYTCSLNKMKNTVDINIKDCVNRSQTKSNIPKELCSKGPVSASISAEQPSFQFAKKGIYYDDECYTTPNHEVLLVGYNGTGKNNSYWIVKNSFGASWGEEGFLKISTKANKDGCTIIGDVSYPIF